MTSSGNRNVVRSYHIQHELEENVSKFVVSAVSADGLAALGARTFAGTVMAKFVSCIGKLIEADWRIYASVN